MSEYEIAKDMQDLQQQILELKNQIVHIQQWMVEQETTQEEEPEVRQTDDISQSDDQRFGHTK